jgi:hypothetical protein
LRGIPAHAPVGILQIGQERVDSTRIAALAEQPGCVTTPRPVLAVQILD